MVWTDVFVFSSRNWKVDYDEQFADDNTTSDMNMIHWKMLNTIGGASGRADTAQRVAFQVPRGRRRGESKSTGWCQWESREHWAVTPDKELGTVIPVGKNSPNYVYHMTYCIIWHDVFLPLGFLAVVCWFSPVESSQDLRRAVPWSQYWKWGRQSDFSLRTCWVNAVSCWPMWFLGIFGIIKATNLGIHAGTS